MVEPPVEAIAITHHRKALEKLGFDILELHGDIEILSWGCDQLWHSLFQSGANNEQLLHFPIAILRTLAARTEQISIAAGRLTRGEIQ